LKNPLLHGRENLEISNYTSPCIGNFGTYFSHESVQQGTQMTTNRKRTILSHENLHFTISWRLEECNETQRKHNVFILDEFINITSVTSINHYYIDKEPNFYCCTVHFDICRVYSPTNALFYLKKHIKIYIKIYINIAPTCFGLRPSSGSLH